MDGDGNLFIGCMRDGLVSIYFELVLIDLTIVGNRSECRFYGGWFYNRWVNKE
jgi:hypothetical protein